MQRKIKNYQRDRKGPMVDNSKGNELTIVHNKGSGNVVTGHVNKTGEVVSNRNPFEELANDGEDQTALVFHEMQEKGAAEKEESSNPMDGGIAN